MNPYCNNSINFEKLPKKFPPQHQSVQPGIESLMVPSPIFDNPDYKGSEKLKGKSVLITGGDSGIGRSVSIAFAKEGANIVISYLYENDDAETTKKYVEKYGGKCYLVPGDISNKNFCEKLVRFTVETLGGIDVLINNAGVQFPLNKSSSLYISPF